MEYNNKTRYFFLTVDEIIDNVLDGKEIYFTNDILEYNIEEVADGTFEPTGWHGVKLIDIFDSRNFIIGYMGSGIDVCMNEENYNEYGNAHQTLKDLLIDYLQLEDHVDLKDCKLCCDFSKE